MLYGVCDPMHQNEEGEDDGIILRVGAFGYAGPSIRPRVALIQNEPCPSAG